MQGRRMTGRPALIARLPPKPLSCRPKRGSIPKAELNREELYSCHMNKQIEARKSKFRTNLGVAILITLSPPACAVGLYYMASRTGCSGGDCGGAMMMVIMIGVVAFLMGAIGALTAAILLINEFWARLADHYAARARAQSASSGMEE